MKNVAELNKELPRQKSQEIRKLTRSTQELRKEFGINKSSRTDFSYENEPLLHKRKRDDLNEFSELRGVLNKLCQTEFLVQLNF